MDGRITQLDTIRGVAVLGILVMNSVSYGLVDIAYFDISVGSFTFLDWVLGVFGEIFADQKFMGLFSLLFGASLLLFLERVQERTSRPAGLSLWRNFLLLCIGILHSSIWQGDVLSLYALCVPMLLLFRNRSAPMLIVGGVVIFSYSYFSSWCVGTYANDAAVRSSMTLNQEYNLTENTVLKIMLFEYCCRASGMMMLGMGLYRSGWLQRTIDSRTLRRSIFLLVGSAVFTAIGVYWASIHQFDATSIVFGNMFNNLATIPMVFGYLGILMWWDRHAKGIWIERVRSLGRMALTNYISQSVICVTLFHYLQKDSMSRSGIWVVVVLLWMVQLYGSEMWLRHFRMGPLEWIWRCVTYRQISTLRRQ